MTELQEMALANPCYLAGETVHPKYAAVFRPDLSVILTVNAGYE